MSARPLGIAVICVGMLFCSVGCSHRLAVPRQAADRPSSSGPPSETKPLVVAATFRNTAEAVVLPPGACGIGQPAQNDSHEPGATSSWLFADSGYGPVDPWHDVREELCLNAAGSQSDMFAFPAAEFGEEAWEQTWTGTDQVVAWELEDGVFIPVVEEFRTGCAVRTTSTRLGNSDLVEVECRTQLDWWDSSDPVEFQLVPYSDGRPEGRLRAEMDRPVRRQRVIQTTVRGRFHELLPLGAFTRSSQTERVTGIPLLRALPLVGGLFGRRETTYHVDQQVQQVRPIQHAAPDSGKAEAPGGVPTHVVVYVRQLTVEPDMNGRVRLSREGMLRGPMMESGLVQVDPQWIASLDAAPGSVPGVTAGPDVAIVALEGEPFEVRETAEAYYVETVDRSDGGVCVPVTGTVTGGFSVSGQGRVGEGGRIVLDLAYWVGTYDLAEEVDVELATAGPEGKAGPKVRIPIGLPATTESEWDRHLELEPGSTYTFSLPDSVLSGAEGWQALFISADTLPAPLPERTALGDAALRADSAARGG